jgi:hypothetical protein
VAMTLRFSAARVPLLMCLFPMRSLADGDGLLATALQQYYKLAVIRLAANGDSLFEPGTVLAVRMEGIVSFGEKDSSYATLCPSELQAGVIHTPRTSTCTTLAPKSRRLLKTSERVCVTAIDVREASDNVSFFVITCAPSVSGDKSGPSRALIVFRFPRGSLAKSTPAKIESVIGQVLSETEARPPESPPDSPRSPSEAVPEGHGKAPEKVTGARNIIEGQTIEEVESILGPPTSVESFGAKIIYLYPDLKIFFSNGRVAGVQPL